MIVCHCAEITEQQIIDAIKNENLGELYKSGLSQYCQSCMSEIWDLVKGKKTKFDSSGV